MNPQRFVICDIEATGLDQDKEIIEVALITIEDDKIKDVYQTLINPLRSVSTFIQDFTSISVRELNEAPKFYDVADAIRMRLEGAVFVSHNTDFDYELLMKKYLELGQEFKLKTYCTLKNAQLEIPGLKSYTLDALCDFFRIKNPERHRAIGDARATLGLFLELQNLQHKTIERALYLPQHEKMLSTLTTRPGLIQFKDQQNKVFRFEPADNMEQRARELLEIKRTNKEILERTEIVTGEITGSRLIAQFRKLLFYPFRPHWLIALRLGPKGEKSFEIKPFKKAETGLWYFNEYLDAQQKLKTLNQNLKSEAFIYREGDKSKEEILMHNMRLEKLCQETRFPNDNLIILGEGRTLHEKSLVLVKKGQVLGYGHAVASDEEIFRAPESFLTRRFSGNIGAELLTKRYLQEFKNLRVKKESWRALSELDSHGRNNESKTI